jgi:IS1 family transposase
MATLSIDKQAAVIGLLVEGGSIRSAERLTGVHRDSIMRLVAKVGRGCDRIMADNVRGFRPAELQMDELWAFVGKRRTRVRDADDKREVGDFWTWTAIDPDSKLIPHAHVGKRTERDAMDFLRVLRQRVEGRVQISTDKLAAYRWGIRMMWGDDVDYGRIVKRYQVVPSNEGRYMPPRCVAIEREVMFGDPVMDRISTSIVERSNLTVRMGSRRFTRLTNGFSKKVDGLRAAVSLHFAHYNFVRKHITIKTTPARAAGMAEREWKLTELVDQATMYGR